MTAPVNPDQLRITIEMGDDYQPSPDLAAALTALDAALRDPGTEVEGFKMGNFEIQDFKARTISFDSLKLGSPEGDGYIKFDGVDGAKGWKV